LLEDNPDFVKPDARRNEVIGRIREGLNDVPISRRVTDKAAPSGAWGISIPGDEDHTIYVWIDALINYLSTVDTDDRRRFWPADVHLIAKDILWFHAVIWPAMLMALRQRPGYDWVKLPGMVYSHSFWIAEGQKMSKSLGNFIDLEKIDHYVETFGLDALRFFLAANGPMGVTDSDFAESRFIDVYNTELANTVGNCASRIANMTNRYFAGKLPEGHRDESYEHMTDGLPLDHYIEQYQNAFKSLDLRQACEQGVGIVRDIDAYIEKTQPFKLAKQEDNLPQVGMILYNCAEAMRIASVMLWPIIPNRINELWRRFGCAEYVDAMANNGTGDFDAWTRWGALKPGTVIEQGDALFPRYQEKK
jgi:methionyl-tRNA synthetase